MKKILSLVLATGMAVACLAGTAVSAATVPEPNSIFTVTDTSKPEGTNATVEVVDNKYAHMTGTTGDAGFTFGPANKAFDLETAPILVMKYRTPGAAIELFFSNTTVSGCGPGAAGTVEAVSITPTETEWGYFVVDVSEKLPKVSDGSITVTDWHRIDFNTAAWFDLEFAAFFETTDDAEAYIKSLSGTTDGGTDETPNTQTGDASLAGAAFLVVIGLSVFVIMRKRVAA